MRLSEITQPFTIFCENVEMLHSAVALVENVFAKGAGQSLYGINRTDTGISVLKNVYYTTHVRRAENVVYSVSDIDELKHLAQTIITNSNWYDDVHTMD